MRATAVALLCALSLAACSSSGATSASTAASAAPDSSASAAAASTDAASSAGPDASALLSSASDNDDWTLPGKTYENNRLTGLSDISPSNVKTLAKAWSTQVLDDGEQESSPIVWHGTMYLATPHDNVLALDAATGKLKWQFPYNPAYVLLYSVNRGVGLADGKVFLATQDCRVVALDANTGKQAWNVNGCPTTPYASTANTWFSMAAYVYKNQIILGTAGGDTGSIGHVMGFSTADGHKLWDWQTVPGPGVPGHNSWPGNSWEHGGAPVWGGLTVDPTTDTVFVAPGNPGPDLVDLVRKGGANLYTDSVVSLSIAGNKPKVNWYYQLTKDDTHDDDPGMPPVLFDGKVGGATRHLVAEGDKAGNFVVLDRTNGKEIYRLAVDSQTGILESKPSIAGAYACPNHGGGIEWNGGSYDPKTNLFLIPSTEECATWKIVTTNPQYIPGQPYTGGPLPKRRAATGKVTAIDLATGKVAWVRTMPYPGEGGVTLTQNGLAFTSDVGGDVYALDPKTGTVLWKGNTGASIVAPISIYADGGKEYVAVLSGQAGNQQTPNVPRAKGSIMTVYTVGPVASAIANTTEGQQAVPQTASGNANLPASVGSAPYTAAQVAAGQKAYETSCVSCHGAQLQGVSAPALTGASFARAHLNLSQVHAIVTTQMPLGAPGSLSPEQYADIMAYLLAYDCVPATGGTAASGGGTAPFPTKDQPAFSKVVFGGRSCPPKPVGHE
jgi:alcohol dehydrogenase (cytochrome c)